MEWGPLILTLKLALTTTAVLLLLSIPLAYWLAFTRSKLKPVIEAFVTLPIVLPPTVLGYYFLVAFSPDGFPGGILESVFGIHILFSFEGLVIASLAYSLPFMVQPIHVGISGLPSSLIEASRSLGKSDVTTLVRIILPNVKVSVITGCVLSFAHTV